LVDDPSKQDDVQGAIPLYYNRKDSVFSDHRPVLALYSLPIIKINRDKKEQLRQSILKDIMAGNGQISKESLKERSKAI